jgi:hypothetical protein
VSRSQRIGFTARTPAQVPRNGRAERMYVR